MPNRDQTGKNGSGAKSGGQRGNCPGAEPRIRQLDGSGKKREQRKGNRRGAVNVDVKTQPST
jgi:hypothetical protein